MANLKRLRGSRPHPKVGDVFRMELLDGRSIFGRVVIAEGHDRGPMPGAILVYIYRPQARPLEVPADPGDLLIPPIWTNRKGWTDGYWEMVDWRPVEPEELQGQHRFYRADVGLVDEFARPLPVPDDRPASVWGLASYRLIDDLVADALEIPRAPLTPADREELQRLEDRSGEPPPRSAGAS